ncbi:hypothetical protein [Streptococcus sciuri]|uniref:Uncharacterized protein n=1 Tax=Streptococcus sciuri TaxID=2973939 RepID=A0ABT2F888_9STRE|nr:hypothetical protein [Streptococcus sciuri]MCS4488413.1 hypothetical protein [Streptococcus sciuri]
MNIYRYKVKETGKVFVGTIPEASEHFGFSTGTLLIMQRKGELEREVVEKIPNEHTVFNVKIYRFSYRGDVFEGTTTEAFAHFQIEQHDLYKLMKNGEMGRVFLRKERREKDKDKKSSSHEKKLVREHYLKRAQMLDLGLL